MTLHERTFDACRPAVQRMTRIGIALLLAGLGGCEIKPADFFAPPPSSGNTQSHAGDNTPREVCVTITATPAQADKAFGLAMTGPSFSQPVQINGTLTSGSMVVRVPINQFGTYSGGVIVGSQSSSYSVNVTSSQGTCT